MLPEEVKRYIRGVDTPEDHKFVKAWLEKKPANKKKLEKAKRVWKYTGDVKKVSDIKINQAWNRLEKQLDDKSKTDHLSITQKGRLRSGKKSNLLGLMLQVAAVLLVGIGLYVFYQYRQAGNDQQQLQAAVASHVIKTSFGERKTFKLSDGTQVSLNSGSQIRYGDLFDEKNRVVYLRGEGYFEVNNTGDHPAAFTVRTHRAYVQDVGTAFDVNASDSKRNMITVTEGKVSVRSLMDSVTAGREIQLSESNQATIYDAQKPIDVRKVNLDDELRWTKDKLVFKKEQFGQIVKKLEKAFNMTIIVKDQELNQKRLTATFSSNQNVKEILSILSKSLNAQYNISHHTVTFR